MGFATRENERPRHDLTYRRYSPGLRLKFNAVVLFDLLLPQAAATPAFFPRLTGGREVTRVDTK